MLPDIEDFCRLFLFRHPELAPEQASLAVGGGDAALSRRGQASLVDWMKALAPIEVDAVFAADQSQCRDSAAALATAKGVELRTDERLNDQSLGEWQGRPWDELAQTDANRVRDFFAEFGEVSAPGGESLGAAVERFLAWWAEVQPRALGQAVVVVTSGAMVTGFAAAMLGMRLSRAVSLNLPHGGLGVLDVFSNGARVATWNPSALAPEDED